MLLGNRLNWLATKFELSRGDGVNQRSMEGLRGFAVFLVFLVHFSTLIEPRLSAYPELLMFSRYLHAIGSSGVDLFFVLSGYLIFGSLISRHQQFSKFMTRRIIRIYPTFLTVFIVYTILSFIFPNENKFPSTAFAGIIYVIQNILLLPGLFPITPLITVAWSLSYEMFYYLIIPGVIALFALRERSPRWRAAFFLCVAVAASLYCAWDGGPIRLIMFVSGMLLFEAMGRAAVPTPSSHLGFLALAIGLLSALMPVDGNAGYALRVWILFVAFFIVCLGCFRPDAGGWLPRAFCWKPLRWLGNMSYSYYLLHGLALKAGFLVLSKLLPATDGPAWLFWVSLPLMFALTLIPTSALFLLIERPFSLAPRRATSA